MRWHQEQIALSKALRPPGRTSVFSSSARPFLRLDFRRSFLLHRRLALGIALSGPVLVVIYMFRLWWLWWTNEPSRSLAHVQPTPGAVVLNVLLMLLGFAILGGAAAVIAHELDQRVTVAADVERVLGMAPMAQLPDLSQVWGMAAEEHLMRLATRIDAVTKDRRMRNCVFTGAGFGAGTTTVATRVKDAIEKLGRAVIIDNGAWNANPPPAQESQDQPALSAARSPKKERAGATREDLVLIDAAPIAYSAAAERIMHRADCAIVVIESGVTTARQLRNTASAIENLHLPFVGFVLNRVQPAIADEALRDSLKQGEPESNSQKTSRDKRTARRPDHTAEPGQPELEPETATASQADSMSIAAAISATAPREMLDEVRAAQPIEMPTAGEASDSQDAERPRNGAARRSEEIPWWLREPKARADSTNSEPRAPGAKSKNESSKRQNGREWQQTRTKTEMQTAVAVTPPTLSELDGEIFSPGIKELDRAKHEPQEDAGIALLLSAIAPFEAMFNPDVSSPGAGVSHAVQSDDDAAHAAHPWIPVPESGSAPMELNGNGGNGHGTSAAAAQFGLHHSMPAAHEDALPLGGENGDHPQHKPYVTVPESTGVSEEFQILPSRRGQYKRNGLDHRHGGH